MNCMFYGKKQNKKKKKVFDMLVAAHMIFRIDVATGVLSRVKTCAPKLPSNQ